MRDAVELGVIADVRKIVPPQNAVILYQEASRLARGVGGASSDRKTAEHRAEGGPEDGRSEEGAECAVGDAKRLVEFAGRVRDGPCLRPPARKKADCGLALAPKEEKNRRISSRPAGIPQRDDALRAERSTKVTQEVQHRGLLAPELEKGGAFSNVDARDRFVEYLRRNPVSNLHLPSWMRRPRAAAHCSGATRAAGLARTRRESAASSTR